VELVEVHAYFKWRRRCRKEGYDVHGGDLEDWFEAQTSLERVFNRITNELWEHLLAELEEARRNGGFKPSADAVSKRAYYKWEARRRRGESSSLERQRQDWREAAEDERQREFARLFHRLVPELRALEDEALHEYLMNGYPDGSIIN
jgi:hypothetical protein